MAKIIAVYGSSRVSPDSDDYREAYAVGRELALAGYHVVTGGYEGIMSAASRGASEAGGHVIGVTTTVIEQLRNIRPNEWVHEEISYPSLRERLYHLTVSSDGYVVMPGGLGTMAELVLAWELIRARDLPRRPLIAYGAHWEKVLQPLRDVPYIRDDDWHPVAFANTPQAVVAHLQMLISETDQP